MTKFAYIFKLKTAVLVGLAFAYMPRAPPLTRVNHAILGKVLTEVCKVSTMVWTIMS